MIAQMIASARIGARQQESNLSARRRRGSAQESGDSESHASRCSAGRWPHAGFCSHDLGKKHDPEGTNETQSTHDRDGRGVCGCTRRMRDDTTATQVATHQGYTTTPTTVTAATPAAPTLKYVGTTKLSGQGTTITSRYEIGTLGYGASAVPPSSVLEACGINYTSVIAQAAFLQGSVTFTYSQGTVPTAISFVTNDPLPMFDSNNNPYIEVGALYVDGNWTCPNGSGLSFTLQPGGSVTYPFWIAVQDAVSNAHPQFTTLQLQQAALDFGPTSDQINASNSTKAYSGPDAVKCSNGVPIPQTSNQFPWYLAALAPKIPFTVSGTTCTAAG